MKTIKIVVGGHTTSKKRKKYEYGRIFLDKKWVGKVVKITALTEEEEIEYKKEIERHEKEIEEHRKELKNHLDKLRSLRGK